MSLSPGSRLGPYEILAPLGAGGMGVVYRARDTRLGREVAIKLLPDIADADAAARSGLMREARTAASLNHANICTVHDVGDGDGLRFIAMELIDGEPLQHAIRRGRFSTERACRIGRQLADALEYAHAHNVVHRDFKSANVILTPGGQAKVLDFGIAVRSASPSEQTHTITFQGRANRLAGTLGYMAPEVLQGSPATVGSDVWALGVVLYEMVAGRMPFEGKADSDLVASILRDAPAPLPSGTPSGVAWIIERCLEKQPADRPSRAGEVALALEVAEPRPSSGDIAADGSAPVRRRSFRTFTIAAAVLGAVAAATYLAIPNRARPVESLMRFVNPIQVTTAVGVEEFPAWSPDGRTLAYAADPSGHTSSSAWDIWVIQTGGGAPINRTADYKGQDLLPSWSPDGSQIAFWSDRDGPGCYVMPALAGVPRRIASASMLDPNPPQWSPDGGEIGCVNGDQANVRIDVVSMQTGQITRQIDLPGETRRSFVTWSRSGHDIAVVESTAGLSSDVSRLWVRHVPSKKSIPFTDGRTKVMSPNWSPDGRTLYFVANSGATMDLWAQTVGDDGTPIGTARALTVGLGIRNASFSADGKRLAYSQGRKVANVWRVALRSDRPATWADVAQMTFDQAFIECLDVNRSGTQLVVSSDRAGSFDLWTLPAAGGDLHQLTTDPSAEWCPAFSPDGSMVAFYAYRTGDREVWIVPTAGGPWRQITDNPGVDMHPGWSADGKELLFLSHRGDWTGSAATPVAGGEVRRIADDSGARWSPVDRRIAYVAGQRLFVAADDGRGPKVVVSNAASSRASWTPDGREILFVGDQGHPGIHIAKADGTGRDRLLMDVSGRRGVVGTYGSPTDGKYVYFTWDEDLGDLWVMNVEGSR